MNIMKRRNKIKIIKDDIIDEANEKNTNVIEQLEHKCYWINKKGDPCPWNSLSADKNYCKRHSIYEGVYNKDDIATLCKCSGCKNMFKKDGDYKQCFTCRNRYEKHKLLEDKEEKKQCLGITQNNTKCTFEPNDNDDYCEKHQSYKKWKGITNSGKNVCYNWVKGCFNIIKLHEKSCNHCKEIKNNNKRDNYHKKKSTAEEYNKENNINKMCEMCNTLGEKIKFINDKCPKCYEIYKKCMNKKYGKSDLEKKFKKYKKNALDNDIEWEISSDEFKLMVESNCDFCSELFHLNEIIRIDNNKSYVKTNCMTCCQTCANIKNDDSTVLLMEKIKIILINNLLIDDEIDELHNANFKSNVKIEYLQFKKKCEEGNITFDIGEVLYGKILNKMCIYCNNFPSGANGISMINPEKEYILGNIEPCCTTCNFMKKNLSHTDFINKLKKIYDYKIKNIKHENETLKNKIVELCKNIKPLEIEKFKKKPEYYENMLYKSTNIEDIIKIQIHLEFVENEKQKDIWNYYRRTVSSLKIYENSKMLGRQIYILVKDSITDKYLGILSLTSDNYNYEDRDRYIGWSHKDKQKIHHLMNMSTCVPLQPFGFNFNGGKLLTSLVFSKEVLEYFNKKYNDHLLGITTTSLYGKSVQYDRLKCLKFVGYTKGNTSHGVPAEVTKLCNDYLKSDSDHKLNYNKKFIILHKTFDKLNISKDDILTANPKGIYFGFTCSKSKDYLCANLNEIPNPLNYSQKSVGEIFKWWIDRWATHRYEHLNKNNKLNNV